jgi:endonuclease YncB( thermonuclease family)
MKPFIILLFAVLLPHVACAADLVEGMAFVVDGDTIEINDDRIRLHGNRRAGISAAMH